MTNHITIDDRLMRQAEKGRMNGFRMRLWDSQAKSLERRGVTLRDRRSTGRKGEASYEVDFSLPLPGSFAQELYDIAMERRPTEDGNDAPPEPMNPPYVMG